MPLVSSDIDGFGEFGLTKRYDCVHLLCFAICVMLLNEIHVRNGVARIYMIGGPDVSLVNANGSVL